MWRAILDPDLLSKWESLPTVAQYVLSRQRGTVNHEHQEEKELFLHLHGKCFVIRYSYTLIYPCFRAPQKIIREKTLLNLPP
jgi:hypothetical protein